MEYAAAIAAQPVQPRIDRDHISERTSPTGLSMRVRGNLWSRIGGRVSVIWKSGAGPGDRNLPAEQMPG